MSITLKRGEIYYLQGKSGIGKSTLFKILLKELPNYGGNIHFDNMDLNNIDIDNISNLVNWIPQEAIIFKDTIKNNIVLGRK